MASQAQTKGSTSTVLLVVDECEASPCHQGYCVNYVPGYECLCGPGFQGLHCEIDIDDCEGVTCSNQGVCEDQVNGYTCSCAPGYHGLHCQEDINECEDVICHHGGNCTDFVNGYKCQCLPGYTGSTCEVNINDCLENQCKARRKSFILFSKNPRKTKSIFDLKFDIKK